MWIVAYVVTSTLSIIAVTPSLIMVRKYIYINVSSSGGSDNYKNIDCSKSNSNSNSSGNVDSINNFSL